MYWFLSYITWSDVKDIFTKSESQFSSITPLPDKLLDALHSIFKLLQLGSFICYRVAATKCSVDICCNAFTNGRFKFEYE